MRRNSGVRKAPPDQLAQACADAMYERDIAAREMGITVDKVREGFSMLSMEVRPEMLNGHGVCHGGFIFALADTAFAYACNSRDSVNLAQSCSIEFISPARAGERLAATARQHFQANRTGLYDVTVRRADGEVVAEFRGRSYRVRGRIVRSKGRRKRGGCA